MLVFMRLVILLSKMFSFHPRGLWPHCVFTPNHPPNGWLVGCFCFVWVELVPCPRGAAGEKDIQISKQTTEIQEMKFERKLFCCLLCELWCWWHRFFPSRFMCFCWGRNFRADHLHSTGESSTLSQLTLPATRKSWFAWLKCFRLICLRGISTSLRLLSTMMLLFAAFH